jgi:hypothetical protein
MKTTLVWAAVFFFAASALAYGDASKEEAQAAIANAEEAIQEMKDFGFSTNAVEDLLESAKSIIVSNKTANYSAVVLYTDQIIERAAKSFELWDNLRAAELKAISYKSRGIDTQNAELLSQQAKFAFAMERYAETESLIVSINEDLDSKRAELSGAKVLLLAGRTFLQKYWLMLVFLACISAFAFWVGARHYRIAKLKKDLKDIKEEQDNIRKLTKEAQERRFKKGDMSDLEYRLKTAAYKRRLNVIKAQIPVYEAELIGKGFKRNHRK